MTPLEAARRLADHSLDDSTAEYDACPFCGLCGGHAADCPWLAMPQIVAALEAAELAVEGMGPDQRLGLPIDETVRRLAALVRALQG